MSSGIDLSTETLFNPRIRLFPRTILSFRRRFDPETISYIFMKTNPKCPVHGKVKMRALMLSVAQRTFLRYFTIHVIYNNKRFTEKHVNDIDPTVVQLIIYIYISFYILNRLKEIQTNLMT